MTARLWISGYRMSAPLETMSPAKDSDPEPSTAPTAEPRLGVMPTTTAKDEIDMDSVHHPADNPPPPARPSICPACGLMADNAVTVDSELTRTATYCDTAGHLWAVTWMAVA